jgi:hypothetical protein
VRDTGPLPTGTYDIGPLIPTYTYPIGYNGMPLTPRPTNYMCDPEAAGHHERPRDNFWIHGNNAVNDASNGCIVIAYSYRRAIDDRGGGNLIVVP